MEQEILNKISELIKKVPNTWAKIIARKMGKSEKSIYAYTQGKRGVRKGQHKEVLRLLIELVELEQADTQKLIS